MGTKLPLLQESRKGRRGLGWQLPETTMEVEMERLNAKYNLDCFSDSELDSESDEGEQYKYEHGYETLI